MASAAGAAPSTRFRPLQTGLAGPVGAARDRIERWLEAERDQLPLWIPVMLGAGVAAWFWLPDAAEWRATILAALAVAALSMAGWRGGRAGVALGVAGLCVAAGVALAWGRAERAAHPVLARPAMVRLRATVTRVEPLPARALMRVRLANPVVVQSSGRGGTTLPPVVRVNIAVDDAPAGLAPGAVIEAGARLMPPNEAGVPGGYDFAEVAWFDRLGATGRASAPITVFAPGRPAAQGWRYRLTRHIEAQLPGSVGGIAAAFVTGDVGAISMADNDAMRRAGLAHLLSISGLHITAAVAATMLVVIRLLALFPPLALRWRLPLVAAGAGAAAAIGYTLLSGAEVPTIRSCVAALLVLSALALGREAVTLRLVAAGAFVVLLLWPESLAGPSFQLSFAAVTAIVALHEHPRVRGWFLKRDEGIVRHWLREGASLLATGLLVELALMPIAVYHFHRAGFYGALANIVAIPLSTFCVMTTEALALLLDVVGLGAPAWWLAGLSIRLLLGIARITAAMPGAVTLLPGTPDGAFALMVIGGLWLALWRTRARRLGLVPLALGVAWALAAPAPDLLVTGDGQHIAVRTPDGGLAILRDKAGDFTRQTLATAGAVDGEPELLSDQPSARCSRDLCLATRTIGARQWRILATRSLYHPEHDALVALCGQVDVVVSDRRLPRDCRPRWLMLGPATLRRTGGLAITFASRRIETVRTPGDEHPWAIVPTDDGPGSGEKLRKWRVASAYRRGCQEGRAGSRAGDAPPARHGCATDATGARPWRDTEATHARLHSAADATQARDDAPAAVAGR